MKQTTLLMTVAAATALGCNPSADTAVPGDGAKVADEADADAEEAAADADADADADVDAEEGAEDAAPAADDSEAEAEEAAPDAAD